MVAKDEQEARSARQQIAFYASTPSYRSVMDFHGWTAVAEELSSLASRKLWDEMPRLISDEILETVAVVTTSESLPQALLDRYTGIADHLAVYLPFIPGERDEFWRRLVGAIHESPSR
jgi:hypothetical protein